jgi:hypothetical protein
MLPSIDAQVTPLLSQFPGPLTLTPSSEDTRSHLLWSGLFGLGSLQMVWVHAPFGWFCFLFWVIGSFLFFMKLQPGAQSLTLTAQGFEKKMLYLGRNSYWRDVSNFTIVRMWSLRYMPTKKFVYYDDIHFNVWKISRIGRRMMGGNAVLADNYGLSAEALACLMTRWRDQALTTSVQ